MKNNEYLIDLTRVEGAQVLENDFLLYESVYEVKERIKEFVNQPYPKDEPKLGFYSTNIFIHGKRGTGKSSVLLTIYEEIRKDENYKENLIVLPIIDVSTNIQSVLIYFIACLKDIYGESADNLDCCDESLDELLYKLEINFPVFLKCFCDSPCKTLCEKELEDLLDKNEIKYLENIYEFISKFLRKKSKKKILLLIDDFDLAYENKTIIRLLVELGIFLNHRDVIIIGAGDYENLIRRVKAYVEEFFKGSQHGNEKAINDIANSYIEKLFPLRNRVNLRLIDSFVVRNKIKVKVENDDDSNEDKKISVNEFLKQHPTFNKLIEIDKEDVIYKLFDNMSIRSFIQTLKAINEKIVFIKSKVNNNVELKDVLISDILILMASGAYDIVRYLSTNLYIPIKLNKNRNNIQASVIETQKRNKEEITSQVWQLFVDFHKFIEGVLETYMKDKDEDKFNFNWKSISDYKDYRYKFFVLLKMKEPLLYNVFYMWMFEILTYLGKYTAPLFLIVWNYIYGIYIAVHRSASEIKGKPKENEEIYKEILNHNISAYLKLSYPYNYEEFERSLNLINYTLNIKARGDFKEHILFTKILKYERGQSYLYYPYRFLLNVFLSILPNMKDISQENIFIYDEFSYEEPEDDEREDKGKKKQEVKDEEIKAKYKEKLEGLKKLWEKLLKELDPDPEHFDNSIFIFAIRAKDLTFKRPRNYYGNAYKYVFSILMPFAQLVSITKLDKEGQVNWKLISFDNELRKSLLNNKSKESKNMNPREVANEIVDFLNNLDKDDFEEEIIDMFIGLLTGNTNK